MESKKRLDLLLTEKGLFSSRARAQAAIIARTVKVEGQIIDAPSRLIESDSKIELIRGFPYVSRAGLKLEHALDRLGLAVTGRSAIDVGASTGGFTDCLLQRGALRVISVDVGYGQFDWRLRNDPRITLFERTNIKNLKPEQLPFRPDLATIDLSFISTAKVLPSVVTLLDREFDILVLLKPQFEGERKMVRKGGLVKEPSDHAKIIETFIERIDSLNSLCTVDIIPSEPKGKDGNIEFFIWLADGKKPSRINVDICNKIRETVATAHGKLNEKNR